MGAVKKSHPRSRIRNVFRKECDRERNRGVSCVMMESWQHDLKADYIQYYRYQRTRKYDCCYPFEAWVGLNEMQNRLRSKRYWGF